MSFLLRSICFLFLVSSFLNTFVSSTQNLCHSDQRDALLEFKNEFLIYSWVDKITNGSLYSKTKSWVNKSDCCSWDGITCDAKSGKVIGLDLSDGFLHGPLKSNSSLFRLRHLRDLNLAGNNFTGSPIPAEFDKLMWLKRLDLSQSSLSGQIPSNLHQLTKLVSLDLSSNDVSIDESFLPLLARNLRNLRNLNMSLIKIYSEIPHEFSNMQSLRSLNLTKCNLFGEFPNSVLLIPSLQSIILENNPNLRGNLPVFCENNSLLELTIVSTAFSGPIPESISSLKHLTSLTLSNSYFSGKIPFSFGNLSHLSQLDLYLNDFVGEIPSSIGNLKELTYFAVGYNKLSGNLPSSILNLTQLRSLSLNSNQFTGSLPPNISQLSKLNVFYSDDNAFTGAILSSLLTIPSLTFIDLSYNQFSDFTGIGNISLLPNLRSFYMDNKNYNKVGPRVDLKVFSSLKNLFILYLSGIPLSTANITSDSDFPSNLEYLYLRGCNITEIPEFIRYERNLWIDLSNNNIKGQVPDWLWRLPVLEYVDLSNNSLSGFNGSFKASRESQIRYVDLSSNAFEGPLFVPSWKYLLYFSGSKNNFTGEIPRSICGLKSLQMLDLSSNNLHGSIPRCLEILMSSLSDLNLCNNSLSGSLPDIFMNAKNLGSLDISHNRMTGKLPASLTGCSALQVLNVESNRINDMFPFQLKSLQKLQVLVLRSNRFHGTLHNAEGVWFGFPQLKIIDVSHNEFLGTLPSDYFLKWTMMSSKRDNNIEPAYIPNPSNGYYFSFVLMSKGVSMEMDRILTIYTAIDFSGNQLHGPIPDSIGLLKELRILDMSNNAFTGHIPSSLENLTNLESLDLSQNNFTGVISRSICGLNSLQILDLSNNNLHGSIPGCLETLMSSLSDLILRNNSLSGSLPDIFMNATSLLSLDVSDNRITGKLPASLTGCSALQVLNVESNRINDMFPFQLKSLQKLQVLVLRSNRFHGTLHNADGVWFGFPQLKIIDASHNEFLGTLPSDYFLNWTVMFSNRGNNIKPEYIGNSYYTSLVLVIKGISLEMERILTIYTAIDFSGNQLHGPIPDSVGLLKELLILNMSSNAFTGHIPSSLANLTSLESLDLSQNKISGEIPPEIGTISSLAWINVSHNQLVGSIPQGTQFQRQNCSSYEGNPGLNGPSLKNVCRDIKAPTPPQPEPIETKEEEEEESLSWVAAGLGFAPGVLFGLAMGCIMASHKHEWFMKTFGRSKQQRTRTR